MLRFSAQFGMVTRASAVQATQWSGCSVPVKVWLSIQLFVTDVSLNLTQPSVTVSVNAMLDSFR